MSFTQGFATVDLILESSFETRGVDAFVLSLINAEKQVRRVFTFLIFQNPSYSIVHCINLRKALASNRLIYFEGFVKGINLILPRTLSEIYGSQYDNDIAELMELAKDRNKIFHGQITSNGLTREDLINRVKFIKLWCKNLADRLTIEIGYDGFTDSYCKSKLNIKLNNVDKFDTIDKYKEFIKNNLQRETKTLLAP